MRCLIRNFVKRTFDLVFALGGLAALSPIFLVIAVLIKRSSAGPIFYRGIRTGRYKKPFKIWKFRSMIVDGENKGGTTTGKNDPRITRIGLLLRKYKLDELPQLVNVLFGEMSFVGPRPEVAEYTESYTQEEQKILSVRPGITDWSSLEFSDLQEHVGSEDPDVVFREKILWRKNQLRLQYVNTQSLASDCWILIKTIGVVLSKPFHGPRT